MVDSIIIILLSAARYGKHPSWPRLLRSQKLRFGRSSPCVLRQTRRVVPSEGSHATFAPRGWKQRALQDFAEQELGQHCEVEHVACGSGLQRIYRFLDSDMADSPASVDGTQHVRGSFMRADYGRPVQWCMREEGAVRDKGRGGRSR